jgi:hypothetical protein
MFGVQSNDRVTTTTKEEKEGMVPTDNSVSAAAFDFASSFELFTRRFALCKRASAILWQLSVEILIAFNQSFLKQHGC